MSSFYQFLWSVFFAYILNFLWIFWKTKIAKQSIDTSILILLVTFEITILIFGFMTLQINLHHSLYIGYINASVGNQLKSQGSKHHHCHRNDVTRIFSTIQSISMIYHLKFFYKQFFHKNFLRILLKLIVTSLPME